jgi:hypothetical protein
VAVGRAGCVVHNGGVCLAERGGKDFTCLVKKRAERDGFEKPIFLVDTTGGRSTKTTQPTLRPHLRRVYRLPFLYFTRRRKRCKSRRERKGRMCCCGLRCARSSRSFVPSQFGGAGRAHMRKKNADTNPSPSGTATYGLTWVWHQLSQPGEFILGLLEAMQKENNFPDPVVSTKCFSPQIAELEDFVF